MENFIWILSVLLVVAMPNQNIYAVVTPPASDIEAEEDKHLSDESIEKLKQTSVELEKIISEIEQRNDKNNLDKIKKDLQEVEHHLTACTDLFNQDGVKVKDSESRPCIPAKVAWALGKTTTE